MRFDPLCVSSHMKLPETFWAFLHKIFASYYHDAHCPGNRIYDKNILPQSFAQQQNGIVNKEDNQKQQKQEKKRNIQCPTWTRHPPINRNKNCHRHAIRQEKTGMHNLIAGLNLTLCKIHYILAEVDLAFLALF